MWRDPPHTFIATANQMKSRDYGALVQPALWLNLDFIKHMLHTFFKGGIYCEMVIPRLKKRIPSRLFEIANDKEAVRKMLLWGGIRGFSGPCVIAVYPINTYSCCVLSVVHPKSPRESWSLNPIRLLTDSSPGNREYPNSYVYLKKELII